MHNENLEDNDGRILGSHLQQRHGDDDGEGPCGVDHPALEQRAAVGRLRTSRSGSTTDSDEPSVPR